MEKHYVVLHPAREKAFHFATASKDEFYSIWTSSVHVPIGQKNGKWPISPIVVSEPFDDPDDAIELCKQLRSIQEVMDG